MDALTVSFARYRRHGDLDALARVFDAVSPQLLALALHVTGNAADAEDALQATFLVAIRKSTSFDSKQSVTPWLAGILAGEANNLRRREQRRRGEPLGEVGNDEPDASEHAEQRELVGHLRTRINALPQEQRQVLLLQLQHGLPPAEIADVLGVPPGTVRMRIHRGLSALRKALPAGLVATLFTSLATRGLAAVRSQVMQAGAAEAAAGVATVTLGGLAMKKLWLSVLALAAMGLCWWGLAPPGTDPAPLLGDGELVAATSSNTTSGRGDWPEDQAATNANERHRQSALAPVGSLRLVLRGDQSVATGHGEMEATSSQGSGVPLRGVLVHAWRGELDKGAADGRHLRGYSDEQGELSFADLSPGPWRVVAFGAGGRVGGVRAVTIRDAEQASLELHLAVQRQLGQVVDERGRPVPGAEVWAGTRLDISGSGDRSVRRAATTDANGRFSVAFFPGDQLLAARKRGFAASRSHPIQQLGEGDVVLVLGREAGGITGSVVDDAGVPICGLPVAIEAIGADNRRSPDGTLLGPYLAHIVHTDERGRFVAHGLPPSRYVCEVWRLPLAPAEQEVRVRADETAVVRLMMRRRVAVHGYVRTPANEPCDGVLVMLTQGGGMRTLRSERDGSFLFAGVDRGAFRIGVANGFCAATDWRDVTRAPEDRPLQLRFDRGQRVRGTLRSASGQALAGWCVDPNSGTHVETASDGSFAFWVPADFEDAVVVAVHRRFAFGAEGEALLEAPVVIGQDLALVVADDALPSASIRGRLVDRSKQAITFGMLALRDREGPPQPVEPDGTFVLSGLEAGSLRLVFWGEQHASTVRTVEVEHGEAVDLGDVALQRSPQLIVQFLRPDGTPWTARPPVPWLRRAGSSWLTTNDLRYRVLDGAVVVDRLRPGRYEVHGPPGDELFVASTVVELAEGERRHLTMPVQVARSIVLTIPIGERDGVVRLVVRRDNGDVVVAEDLRGDEALSKSVMLPLGRYDVTGETDDGVVFRRALDVGPESGRAGPVEVPRVR